MASVTPRDLIDRLAFYETHVPIWLARAAGIGTTAPVVTALQTRTVAARAAFNAQQAAQDAAKAATLTFRDAMKDMDTAGSDIIKQVKSFASTTGDNSVYALAEIPAPAAPSPVPPPGQPNRLKVELGADGELNLSWKCPNPRGSVGTFYQIWRKVGPAGGSGAGDMIFLGVTGPRKFTDISVPAGSAQVTYRIVAARSTAQGPAATFLVNLGVGGAGERTASVSPKLAA